MSSGKFESKSKHRDIHTPLTPPPDDWGWAWGPWGGGGETWGRRGGGVQDGDDDGEAAAAPSSTAANLARLGRRISDVSETKMLEGDGSWDVLEWTKTDQLSKSASHSLSGFLLEAELILAEGHGVVLLNTDEAGTLYVTNYRLLLLSEVSRNVIQLGSIPLSTIERFTKQVPKPPALRQFERIPSHRLLQVVGKDMRIIMYGFRPKTKQRRAVLDALLGCMKPERLWDMYAFTCGGSKCRNLNPKLRLLREYARLLGYGSYNVPSIATVEDLLLLSNERWRISKINSNYTLCSTYPFSLIVPRSISDQELLQASSFRSRCRLPIISWCNPETGTVLARSSQPLVGLMMNMRSNADEKLVAALCTEVVGGKSHRRKLYIADARPRKNALANGAMGGGSESSSNYFQSEVVFFGIDNIHAMRESLARLRDYLDTHGSTSSDGMSSFMRHGESTWGGGNLSSMSASVSTLGDTGWLNHIQSLLAGSAWIAARIAMESASVLVHCSDGWDRTTQLVSLASLLLDPFYRTFKGFQALVEKDWLAFGHPFSERMGLPTISEGGAAPSESSRQPSGSNLTTSPMRVPSASASSSGASSHPQTSNNCSPIFLQWVDCISQLLRMYPCAFEFTMDFLVEFLDCMLSCRFGNFLCNSEKERELAHVSDGCGCVWDYLADLRASDGSSHSHFNMFYDPIKYSSPLLPPAAALAPILWPQFHLRWACPLEARANELDIQCRVINNRYSEAVKAKGVAEMQAANAKNNMDALAQELEKERQRHSSTMNMAKGVLKENAAIKRALQSIGCKVNFSKSGSCSMDLGGRKPVTSRTRSSVSRDYDGEEQTDEVADVSVSISSLENDVFVDNPVRSVCEALCPFRTREGCRWPDAGCAQLGSQFVGFTANFDAFDRLSIFDRYFAQDGE